VRRVEEEVLLFDIWILDVLLMDEWITGNFLFMKVLV